MSEIKPAHAFIECPEHGRVGITFQEFTEQIVNAETPWRCPVCEGIALLDTEDYVSRHEKEQ